MSIEDNMMTLTICPKSASLQTTTVLRAILRLLFRLRFMLSYIKTMFSRVLFLVGVAESEECNSFSDKISRTSIPLMSLQPLLIQLETTCLSLYLGRFHRNSMGG